MYLLFETLNIAAIEPLLLGIPESLGLLLFGIGLAAMAMLLRWILGRNDEEKADEKFGEKV